MKENKAFTLVELIVVVTILAILATIWFVSYSSYLVWVRDSNRAAQLVSISDGMELYRTKKDLPLPDNYVEIKYGSGLLWYQGEAGSNTLETIDFTKWWTDPKTDEYFTYYLTQDRKYFQLMAFFEEDVPSPLKSEITVDSNVQADVFWKNLGILTNSSNVPIHKIGTLQSTWLDLEDVGTDEYIAYLKNGYALAGSGTSLQVLKTLQERWGEPYSCKNILESGIGVSDGVYNVYNGGDLFQVYCNMTTDGWWWTLIDGVSDRFWSYAISPEWWTPNLNNYSMEAWNLQALVSNSEDPTFKYSLSDGSDSLELYIQLFDIKWAVKRGNYSNYDTEIVSESWVTQNLTTEIQPKMKANYTRYNLRSLWSTWPYGGHLKSYNISTWPHSWWTTNTWAVQNFYLNETILSVPTASLPTFWWRFNWFDSWDTNVLHASGTADYNYSTDPALAGQMTAWLYVK